MKTYYTPVSDDEVLKRIPCPLCRSEKFSPYWRCETHQYVRCDGCQIVMQNPQPVFESLKDRYDKRYFEYEIENEGNFYNLARKGLDDIGFEDLFKERDQQKKFLDIGCATGKLLGSLKESGEWEVRGVELCQDSAEYGRKTHGVDIFNGTLEEAKIESDSYDVVFNAHVIEHLNDPLLFVQEIARILKPGGYYICITPNVSSLQALVFKSDWRSSITDHTFLFGKKRLKSLMEECDLSVIQEQTWGGWAIGAKPKFLKPLLDKLAKRWGFGDVVMLVSQLQKS